MKWLRRLFQRVWPRAGAVKRVRGDQRRSAGGGPGLRLLSAPAPAVPPMGAEVSAAALNAGISAYEEAIAALKSQQMSGLSPELKVLRILRARDDLVYLLAPRDAVGPEALQRITTLDQQLRQNSDHVVQLLPTTATLKQWRAVLQPPRRAWWWFLEEVISAPPPAAPRSGAVWVGIASLLLVLSVGLTLEIASRFLRIEPDLFGILNLLAQGLLTLLAGSTLFRLGEQYVERILARLGIAPPFRPPWKAALAFAVLLFVVIVRFSLPSFARCYNTWGLADQHRGNLTSAVTNYQRAISLDPDYAQAHYNLGDAYEDGLEYDRALGEYQRALLADPQFYAAYNNLARLLIVSKGDFAGALTPLNIGLEKTPAGEDPVRYTLLKNRGWANLGLGYWAAAEADLRAALTLHPRGAAAHCLLAQTLERLDNPRADPHVVRGEWEGCLRYANEDPKPEAHWLVLAQERLR